MRILRCISNSYRVKATGVFCACIIAVSTTTPAMATDAVDVVGSIFGALMNSVALTQVQNDWNAVDKDIRECISNRTNTKIEQIVQQGIRPKDPRLASHMQFCTQEVARAEERQRQEREAAAARAAQATRAKAKKAERHQEFVDKYGEEVASAIQAGEVIIGMPKEAAIAAKGKPRRTDVIPPSDELWYYGNERVAFSNGVATYVEH